MNGGRSVRGNVALVLRSVQTDGGIDFGNYLLGDRQCLGDVDIQVLFEGGDSSQSMSESPVCCSVWLSDIFWLALSSSSKDFWISLAHLS